MYGNSPVDDVGSLAEFGLHVASGNDVANGFRKNFADRAIDWRRGTRYSAHLKLLHKKSQGTPWTI